MPVSCLSTPFHLPPNLPPPKSATHLHSAVTRENSKSQQVETLLKYPYPSNHSPFDITPQKGLYVHGLQPICCKPSQSISPLSESHLLNVNHPEVNHSPTLHDRGHFPFNPTFRSEILKSTPDMSVSFLVIPSTGNHRTHTLQSIPNNIFLLASDPTAYPSSYSFFPQYPCHLQTLAQPKYQQSPVGIVQENRR